MTRPIARLVVPNVDLDFPIEPNPAPASQSNLCWVNQITQKRQTHDGLVQAEWFERQL